MLMRHVPFAARIYQLLLAWELDRVFFSFRMNAKGGGMRQKIQDATFAYIETDAPPQYREILKPNYEPGYKRRVNTATYLSSLHSTQMCLTKDRVVKIGPDHVVTETGDRYSADAIIYATGFFTQKWLHAIEAEGIGGRDLHQVWDASGGAEAYKGTVVNGFPNFFILYGPNAATGQHSVIFHSECQINYSCRLLRKVLGGSADSIMVKPLAQQRDLAWVHRKLQGLVFNSGCQSWWMDPLTKKNTFIYPDPMYMYWVRTIFPRWSDFEIRKNQAGYSFSVIAISIALSLSALTWSFASLPLVIRWTMGLSWLPDGKCMTDYLWRNVTADSPGHTPWNGLHYHFPSISCILSESFSGLDW